MNNGDYWRGRFAILEDAAQKQADQCVFSLEGIYREAERTVQADLERWYGRFAVNNGVSLTEARKMLTTGQLEEFRWTVDQYIKAAQQANLSPEWIKKLENASTRFHVSRLETIQLQIQQQMELLYGNQTDSIDDFLKKVVSNGYTRGCYELHKGIGLGWDVTALNQKRLETLLSKPWTGDNKTFRDRCWEGKANLVSGIQTRLTQALLRGDQLRKTTEEIHRQFGVARYKAGRLVHTETTYFNAVASREAYKEIGVDMVEIIETLDSHTCEICQPLDGKVIPMTQYEPGVTVPPFHPNCRGTTAPAIDPAIVGERAARNEDGTPTYNVPSNMKYTDWAKAFYGGGSKAGLTVAGTGAILKAKRALEQLEPSMFPDYLTSKKERKNTQTLMDYVNGCEGADPDVVALYARMGQMENIQTNGIPVAVKHTKNHAINYRYNRFTDKLVDVDVIIPKLNGDDLTGQVVTTLHEEMHLMDFFNRTDVARYDGWASSSNQKLMAFFQKTSTDIPKELDDLFDAFDKECTRIRDELWKERMAVANSVRDQYYAREITFAEYKKLTNKATRDFEDAVDYQCRNAMGGGISSLEDIYDALSGGTAREAGLVRYGHGINYYREIGKRAEETLANYAALSIVRPDLIATLRQYEPDLVDALDEVIQEMLKKVGG